MLTPTPPIPAAVPLAPVGVTASPSFLLAPAQTSLRVGSAGLNVLDGSSTTVTGTLLDAHRTRLARRVVVLQALGKHGWGTVANDRTGPRGRFTLHYTPRAIGSRLLRVRFS